MRIAVTYDNGMVFQHFGHSAQFKVYDIEDGQIVSSQVVDTMGQGHGALGFFLFANKVNAVICGGIGPGAVNALSELHIDVFPGVQGDCDEAVRSLLSGTLPSSTQSNCSCHDHGGDHNCGNHHEGECGHHCH